MLKWKVVEKVLVRGIRGALLVEVKVPNVEVEGH